MATSKKISATPSTSDAAPTKKTVTRKKVEAVAPVNPVEVKEKPAPAKKPRVIKAPKTVTTPVETSTATVASTSTKSAQKNTVTPEMRYRMIAEAAYYRAEQRGFAGGNEMEDWKASEAEIDARLNA